MLGLARCLEFFVSERRTNSGVCVFYCEYQFAELSLHACRDYLCSSRSTS